MTYHEKYSTPIFHIAFASTEQLKTMEIVFDTLEKSGVRFCTVEQGEEEETLVIYSSARLSKREQRQILAEVITKYIDDERVKYIFWS